MVYIPKFKISEVITGGSDSTHPAFIVNGQEVDGVYLSKYQNVVYNSRAYSLPVENPQTSLTFDQARQACEAKGLGWHLMTNAEWAALALWCRKNGTIPKGNNNYGKDYMESSYMAIPATHDSNGRVNRVYTGTGPLTWSHNGQVAGIWDLNGNVYEWVGGYRTVDGEIQILPNNDAADCRHSQGASSPEWKAVMPAGTLVTPGTSGTLKWDYTNPVPADGAPFRLNTVLVNQADNTSVYGGNPFHTLSAVDGVAVPEILKALALFPADNSTHDQDMTYMQNIGERMFFRGGSWSIATIAGVFYQSGLYARTYKGSSIGFRCAYVAEIS